MQYFSGSKLGATVDLGVENLSTRQLWAFISEAKQQRVSDPPTENICLHSAVIKHQYFSALVCIKIDLQNYKSALVGTQSKAFLLTKIKEVIDNFV